MPFAPAVDKMIACLEHYFDPAHPEPGYSLGISGGCDGARLTHSHERQYNYALQSLTLWREISHDMFKLWCLAEGDLLRESNSYRLQNTGQVCAHCSGRVLPGVGCWCCHCTGCSACMLDLLALEASRWKAVRLQSIQQVGDASLQAGGFAWTCLARGTLWQGVVHCRGQSAAGWQGVRAAERSLCRLQVLVRIACWGSSLV